MDAKYNFLIDSLGWRIALNLTGFVLWLGTVFVVMKLAA